MTYWCPICAAHREEDEFRGEDFGSRFFPDGVLVCEVCMDKHKGNAWFNEELINFEKAAEAPLNRAIEHLTGVKGEEEDLEYGENIHLLFEENKKLHDEVERLKKKKVDFENKFTLFQVTYP